VRVLVEEMDEEMKEVMSEAPKAHDQPLLF
jgi:hypothetical protein